MSLRGTLLSLMILAALAFVASSEEMDLDDLSGSGIRADLHESFKDETIGYLDPTTGMSPGVPTEEEGLMGTPATPPAGTDVAWANVAGRWSLNLMDSMSRDVDLTLFQHGNEVFGRGTMSSAISSQEITAAGSVTGNDLTLRLVTVGGGSMYRLRLTHSGGTIMGPYNAYTSDGTSWAGSGYGDRYMAPTITSFASDSQPIITIGGMQRSGSVGMA